MHNPSLFLKVKVSVLPTTSPTQTMPPLIQSNPVLWLYKHQLHHTAFLSEKYTKCEHEGIEWLLTTLIVFLTRALSHQQKHELKECIRGLINNHVN